MVGRADDLDLLYFSIRPKIDPNRFAQATLVGFTILFRIKRTSYSVLGPTYSWDINIHVKCRRSCTLNGPFERSNQGFFPGHHNCIFWCVGLSCDGSSWSILPGLLEHHMNMTRRYPLAIFGVSKRRNV